ncbi:MAG: hypothetical protein LUH48_05040 [Clostridiales bacterium]|nr:hypothetical protein [Clostridiales bacterium]
MSKRTVEKFDFKAIGAAIKSARKEQNESRKSGTELAAVQQQLTSGHAAIQQMESSTREAEKAADAAEKKMTQAEQALRIQSMTFMRIDSMVKKTLTGNIALAPDEARELKELAKKRRDR